jgi:tRNA threonylcarbamoyladenosine biosynthesis protein TsaB
MIVLGIDTSGYANALGIADDDRVLAEVNNSVGSNSIQGITADIDNALQTANISIKDIDGIGVGLGPGSWTGIRIGVTVGKMLAFSMGVPVAGVPTLEALAYGVYNMSLPVWAIIDVGTGDNIYAAQYRADNENLAQIGEYYVGDIKGLAALVKQPVIIAGANALPCAKMITEETGIEIKALELKPSGAIIACLAARRLECGDNDDVLSLTPLYLKESTAKAFVNKYRAGNIQGT